MAGIGIDGRAWAVGVMSIVIVGGALAQSRTPAGSVAATSPPAAVVPVPGAVADPAPPATVAPNADAKPAKILFGAAKSAAQLAPQAIGFYSRGCLAGGRALAIDGPAWQVMRLSRNRNWGHPMMVEWLERFAKEVQVEGWPGLLVGDIAQPRGGPMLTGHASHQIGLDADIWLTPMPDRRLSAKEREELSATSMIGADQLAINPEVWTGRHVALIRHAALSPGVERVLVHPAIKKALCQNGGSDRAWLAKVRPFWGHHYHMHIRLGCPADSPNCRGQAPPPGDDGCGAEVDDWIKIVSRPPPPVPVKPSPPPKPITLDELPVECRVVLAR